MSYRSIIARTRKDNILFSVLLELTYKCNLDCDFCYNDVELTGEPISEQRYLALLDELAKLQVLHLTLSGGEPLANPAFFRIGAHARSLGFLTRIKSNGHALNKRLARRLKGEVNPFLVDVSLHGASPETHDRQTRVPGSFKQLLDNLATMKELGLRLKINSLLTTWNEHELEAMFATADSLDIPIQISTAVTPKDNGDRSPLSIAASDHAVSRMYELLAEREPAQYRLKQDPPAPDGLCSGDPSEASDKHCGAGASTLAIDPFGSVYPCVQWRRSIGNIHDNSIGDIWNGVNELSQVRELGRRINMKLKGEGEGARFMGFCPGLAELQTGSALEIYPAARQHADLSLKILSGK